jgi:hypothetical protein
MRTIRFNTHNEDVAADTIAKMLLDLPRGGQPNHIQFDPDGERYTVAWRLAAGTWGVAFRPAGQGTHRRYDNPVRAARAVITRQHDPEDVTAAVLATDDH